GQQVWHKSPVRDEYYYGIFTAEMPDLNYATAAVRDEAERVGRFWLTEMGVDGFRLDAVPYLVEEGTMLSGAPGTHRVLRDYQAHLRSVKPDVFTVGEVWDSVGAMLPYYPDQLDAYFAFELADALINAVNNGSSAKLLDGYLRLQRTLPQDRWSPFLRNHDQTRTLTDLGGDRAKAAAAVTLLLTLPGLPFLYYGEEIGMIGNKRDGDESLRTPMQWGGGGPHGGFTTGTPWHALQADSQTVTVAAQETDPNSLLNLHRRLIHLRATNPALAGGDLVPLTAGSGQVAAYLRREGRRAVLVVANLGATPVSNVALASEGRALRAGRYTPRGLLGSAAAAPLRVGADGRVQGYVPLPTLGPLQVHVLELAAAR
ncbi:MAG TPA: alpha-amylase family glycosyl hydrolase, partial [Longimicrobium sp.]|nr:alpha-amylase family glycosyl hydrolase [Longimicrobium sp.]